MRKAKPVAGPDGSHSTGVRALTRGIAVLECVLRSPNRIGLSELARATGLAKPVVLRCVRTWEEAGYIMQTGAGDYRPGWRLLMLAAARTDLVDFRATARRYLERLNELTHETVHLGVLTAETEVTYVDKIEGRLPIRVYTEIGRPAPAYATASGKALLAHQSPEFLSRLFERRLESFNANTLSDPADLRRDLLKVRELGYSVNFGEWHEEVGGVGAVLLSGDGRAQAAVSVACPVGRLQSDMADELGEIVSRVASEASAELGWWEEGTTPVRRGIVPPEAGHRSTDIKDHRWSRP